MALSGQRSIQQRCRVVWHSVENFVEVLLGTSILLLIETSNTSFEVGKVRFRRNSEAIPLLFAAFETYEDKIDRTRALSDLGMALKNLGQSVAAKHAFSLALRHCTTTEMRINATLELLEVAALIGDSETFRSWRNELDAARHVMQPDATVDFYIKMGQGLSMFGDVDEASNCLRKAISLAENHDLNTYLFRAEQLLERLGDVAAESRGTSAREGGTHPEVEYVAARLETLVVGAAAG